MRVRNAKLKDVVGRSAKFGGIAIVPAEVELDGQSFQASFALRDIPAESIPPVLRVPIEQQFDVAWVRARLPVVFGISPEPSEVEKTFLCQAFVAIPEGSEEGVAFECMDYYGKTSLIFSPAEGDEQLKQRVAEAFWSLLLEEPDSLMDFSGTSYHVGAGVWLHFGCEDGEPFCYETEGEEE